MQNSRPAPLLYHFRVEVKIKQLEDQDIVESVAGPAPWLSPVVIFDKPNGSRMRLSSALITLTHYQRKFFKTLLALNSSPRLILKGMLSPNSTCWVLSSPDNLQNLSWPGACVGLEICQLVIGQILEGLPNASNIADDFLVHGATKEEHYKSLESTLLLLHKRHLLIQSIHSNVYLVSQNWTTMDFTS